MLGPDEDRISPIAVRKTVVEAQLEIVTFDTISKGADETVSRGEFGRVFPR